VGEMGEVKVGQRRELKKTSNRMGGMTLGERHGGQVKPNPDPHYFRTLRLAYSFSRLSRPPLDRVPFIFSSKYTISHQKIGRYIPTMFLSQDLSSRIH
jgi:hypothetical protein